MKIKTIPVGMLEENCYIISTQNNNAVAIDCGAEAEKIMRYLENEKLTLKKILLTHGHFDHIGAVAEIVAKTNATVYIHSLDSEMLSDNTLNLALTIGAKVKSVDEFVEIKDGDIITQDEFEFKVLHTSGHTKGGVCYICENSIFSGDTLFKGEVGRTDFPGGSFPEILASVQKIARLEGDFDVYSGHGESSTLERERNQNMYIKGNYNDTDF